MKKSKKIIVFEIKLFTYDLTYKSSNHIDPLNQIITNTTRIWLLGFSMKILHNG